MTDSCIFRVDDGSTWHFDAPTREAARAQWIASILSEGYNSEADILEEFGEPEIALVPLVHAMEYEVTDDEIQDSCPRCSGSGRVPRKVTLLDWWRENREKKPENRAKHGALCNSEWP